MRVVMVNALMTVAQVLDTVQLAQGLAPSLGWALVEMTPELYMERLLEDHEYVLETLTFWSRDSENRLVFMDKPLKYDLFLHPEVGWLAGPPLGNSMVWRIPFCLV